MPVKVKDFLILAWDLPGGIIYVVTVQYGGTDCDRVLYQYPTAVKIYYVYLNRSNYFTTSITFKIKEHLKVVFLVIY